jgi:hypothetical protein
MTRVLFLAYHFPPLGGAGVQRSVQFVRRLPAHGYQPVVVTGPGDADGPWTPLDATLSEGLRSATRVLRVLGPVPAEGPGNRGRIERCLGVPSAFGSWWRRGAEGAARDAGPIDLLFATMSPFESAAAAAAIARERRVPWVADLRDPWALDEMLAYPTAIHRRLEQERMRRALRSAAAIVMNTPEAARVLTARFPELERTPVHSIPNGFDAADFDEEAPEGPPARGFRIVHTGFMHTAFATSRGTGRGAVVRRALGGAPDVDPSTRSHVVLMRGLALLQDREPQLASGIELHLAGKLSETDRAVDGRGLVRERGYLPHDKSVAVLRSADLLFLPMHALPAGRRARIVPGKTYEYLGAARPVLAAVPDGDARDILEAIPWAHVCEPRDAGAMAAIVGELASRKAVSGPAPDGDRALVADYERGALAARLAAVLDGVMSSAARSGHAAAAARSASS